MNRYNIIRIQDDKYSPIKLDETMPMQRPFVAHHQVSEKYAHHMNCIKMEVGENKNQNVQFNCNDSE